MENMNELGLADRLLELRHSRVPAITFEFGGFPLRSPTSGP
jgi:hypothetical protein